MSLMYVVKGGPLDRYTYMWVLSFFFVTPSLTYWSKTSGQKQTIFVFHHRMINLLFSPLILFAFLSTIFNPIKVTIFRFTLTMYLDLG